MPVPFDRRIDEPFSTLDAFVAFTACPVHIVHPDSPRGGSGPGFSVSPMPDREPRVLLPFGGVPFAHANSPLGAHAMPPILMWVPPARQMTGAPVAGEDEFDPAATVPAGTSVEDIGALRTLYAKGVEAIGKEANLMRARGVPVAEVADWANKTRNATKQTFRDQGPKLIKWLAEQRNIAKYGKIAAGPKLGPTADEFRAIGRSNEQIIDGATRGSSSITRGAVGLRIAGRILIGIDITLAGIKVAQAPEVDRPKVLLEESGALAGAVAGAAAGALTGEEIGGWIGAGIGGIGTAPVGGEGAIPGLVIGKGIGGLVGGVIGAFSGAFAGRKAAELVVNELYPPSETRFEGVPW